MRGHSRLHVALASTTLATVLAGCSRSLGSDGPAISLSGYVDRSVTEPPTLQVDIGGREATIELRQAGSRPVISREIHGPRYGDVPVQVALVSSSGARLAAVEFVQEFERGNNHWVSAVVGPRRPLGFCIGTVEVAPLPGNSFPPTTEVPDTLFVMHGRIPTGAVC